MMSFMWIVVLSFFGSQLMITDHDDDIYDNDYNDYGGEEV